MTSLLIGVPDRRETEIGQVWERQLTISLCSRDGVEVSVSHDNHVGVSRVSDELIDMVLRTTSGAKESGILTHVQREHLPEVGHVPRQRAGHQSVDRHYYHL